MSFTPLQCPRGTNTDTLTTEVTFYGIGYFSVSKAYLQWTFINTDTAEGTFFRVNEIYAITLYDSLIGTGTVARSALVADMYLECPWLREFAFNMYCRLFRIIILKVYKSAYQFAQGTPGAFFFVQ